MSKNPKARFGDFVCLGRKNQDLNSMANLFQEYASDLPVSRSAKRTAKRAAGSQAQAVVRLLSIVVPCDERTMVEAVTGLFPKLDGGELAEILRLNACSTVSPLQAIRKWYTEHRGTPSYGIFCNLLRIVDEMNLIMESGTIPEVVNAAIAIVSKQLGFYDTADSPPSQYAAFSQPPSSQKDAVDSMQDILKAAANIEHEVDLLRQNDAAYQAQQENLILAALAGEEVVADAPDEPDFFVLISQDIRRKETSIRKKLRLTSSTVGKLSVQAKAVCRSEKNRRRDTVVANVSILAKRAREEFRIFEGVRPDRQNLERPHHYKDNDSVRLMTVHKAKGSQWKWVFVVNADGDSFPVEGNSPFEYPPTLMEEERRIFYVACTRAVEQLTICFHSSTSGNAAATMDHIFQSATPFLPPLTSKILKLSVSAICSEADVAAATEIGVLEIDNASEPDSKRIKTMMQVVL
jgi:UvrD-like helicase C-terminal domain